MIILLANCLVPEYHSFMLSIYAIKMYNRKAYLSCSMQIHHNGYIHRPTFKYAFIRRCSLLDARRTKDFTKFVPSR